MRFSYSMGLRFSTLFRVSAGATAIRGLKTMPLLMFQYPLSGQCWCNARRAAGRLLAVGVFQYPLSGQCWCNLQEP